MSLRLHYILSLCAEEAYPSPKAGIIVPLFKVILSCVEDKELKEEETHLRHLLHLEPHPNLQPKSYFSNNKI